MDSLNGTSPVNPWIAVLTYATLRLAASESGIELVRQRLWIPVQYYSREIITRVGFSHIMNLSADFHDSKSTSDLMLALSGSYAVSSAVESVLLQATPMLVDMLVATVYLSITFGPYEGFITVTTGIVFLMFTSKILTESRLAATQRRNAVYEESYIRQSGFVGWPTVSAFNQIGYEDNRHADAVARRWMQEKNYTMSWYVSVALQTLILSMGLLASAFLAVFCIRKGDATPGQFAMLLMYWGQLTSPLKFFASLGKSMSDDFINAERLLAVMKTQPTIESKKGARPLKFTAGKVHFDNIFFSYDKKKEVIKGISLEVPAGQQVAFVGATGAGKSTLLRLLNRFYDTTQGAIYIDNQDIREVDLFR